MYKYLLLLLLFFSLRASSQTNANEAKAAYLLAEESYGKGDMKSTLEYLDDASVKLGSANAKILYLKIMAERELANKDTAYISKLASSINNFEKAPDSKDFNEEKTLEVMKIKLQLNKDIAQKRKAEDQNRLIVSGMKAFAAEHTDWPLGATLEELKVKHPAMFAPIKKKQESYATTATELGLVYTFPNVKLGVNNLYLKNGRLVGYSETLLDITNDDVNYSKGKEVVEAVLKKLNDQLKTEPVASPSNIQDGEFITNEWRSGQNILSLTKLLQLFNGWRISKITLFFYHPSN